MSNKEKRIKRSVDRAVQTHLDKLIKVMQSERKIGTILNVLFCETHFKILDINLIKLPKHKYQVQIRVDMAHLGIDTECDTEK